MRKYFLSFLIISLILISFSNEMALALTKPAECYNSESECKGAHAKGCYKKSSTEGETRIDFWCPKGIYVLEVGIPLPGGGTQKTASGLAEYIKYLYVFALGLVGITAMGGIIYGGFLYMTAMGSTEMTRKGKDQITNALWGLGIALCSYLLLYTINPDLVNLKDPHLIPAQLKKKTIGQDCGNNSECLTNFCVGTCEGSNDFCQGDDNCPAGKICQSKECTEPAMATGKPCFYYQSNEGEAEENCYLNQSACESNHSSEIPGMGSCLEGTTDFTIPYSDSKPQGVICFKCGTTFYLNEKECQDQCTVHGQKCTSSPKNSPNDCSAGGITQKNCAYEYIIYRAPHTKILSPLEEICDPLNKDSIKLVCDPNQENKGVVKQFPCQQCKEETWECSDNPGTLYPNKTNCEAICLSNPSASCEESNKVYCASNP